VTAPSPFLCPEGRWVRRIARRPGSGASTATEA